jgi:hypothetical protein
VARVHRTTTTATLLVTVAVSALTGCVTVQRQPVPGPPHAPSNPSAPRPDGSTEPQVVQAPAREALEMAGPSGRPSPTAPTPHRGRRPDTGAVPPAAPHHPYPGPRPRWSRHPGRIEVPPAASQVFPRNRDVCDLGHRYGGWQADSPEARICAGTYGR